MGCADTLIHFDGNLLRSICINLETFLEYCEILFF